MRHQTEFLQPWGNESPNLLHMKNNTRALHKLLECKFS